MKETTAPCSSCIRWTTHKVLHERSLPEEDRILRYEMLECAGCHRVSLVEHVTFDGDDVDVFYYPSPVSRKLPDWVFDLLEDEECLLREIYQAVDGGQHRLAAMGIRALLEQVMVSRVGDLGSFQKQLDAFEKGGYISFIQRDAMKATLEVGHAVMHRAFEPTEQDLKVALDVVEGIMAPIYVDRSAAEKMADRVPPRSPRKS